jgi:hypothetical protein
MTSPFDDLFLKHGAAAYDKQIYLQAQFGKTGWAFDLNSGVLAFRRPHAGPLQLSVHVLGTESEETKTWLWAWANDSAVPPTLMTSALQLKQIGVAKGIPEFTAPEWPITPDVNPPRISLVASGMLRASAYFRAPYPKGAAYLLIKDPKYKRSVTKPIQRIAKAFPLFLAKHFVSDQRAAYLSYLKFYRLDVEERDHEVIATTKVARGAIALGQQQLVAEFDARNRLTNLR